MKFPPDKLHDLLHLERPLRVELADTETAASLRQALYKYRRRWRLPRVEIKLDGAVLLLSDLPEIRLGEAEEEGEEAIESDRDRDELWGVHQ